MLGLAMSPHLGSPQHLAKKGKAMKALTEITLIAIEAEIAQAVEDQLKRCLQNPQGLGRQRRDRESLAQQTVEKQPLLP